MTKSYRGFFTILSTPFNAKGEILWADLERLADFVCRSGCHGVVWPVNDSEFSLLSYAERLEGFTRIVNTVNRRLPVILAAAATLSLLVSANSLAEFLAPIWTGRAAP